MKSLFIDRFNKISLPVLIDIIIALCNIIVITTLMIVIVEIGKPVLNITIIQVIKYSKILAIIYLFTIILISMVNHLKLLHSKKKKKES